MKGVITMSEYENDETKSTLFPIETKTCPTISSQRVDVCVPVTIKPFANVGATVLKCCGDAVILPGHQRCIGKKEGACVFTITQTICVEVPVEFGAVAKVGDSYVDCLCVSSDEICKNCHPDGDMEE
jgi:hypothetical protein